MFGYLGFSVKIIGFLRNLRFPNALFSMRRRESAKVGENLRLGSVCLFPSPSFPCFFGKEGRENHQNKDFFISTEPLKSLEKKGKKLPKNEFLAGKKKNKEFKKKTRTGRTGLGSSP